MGSSCDAHACTAACDPTRPRARDREVARVEDATRFKLGLDAHNHTTMSYGQCVPNEFANAMVPYQPPPVPPHLNLTARGRAAIVAAPRRRRGLTCGHSALRGSAAAPPRQRHGPRDGRGGPFVRPQPRPGNDYVARSGRAARARPYNARDGLVPPPRGVEPRTASAYAPSLSRSRPRGT